MADLDAVLIVPRYAPRIQPTPIPASAVFDPPAVCVTINERWVSHLLGLLEVLDQPDAWTGTDEEIYQARQQVRELGLAMRQGNCEGLGLLLRQNETNPCILETSADAGVTWVQVADLTLCAPPAPKPPRTIYDDVRIGPVSGEPEVSLDGGTTWTPVPEPDAPSGWYPARSPQPGDTQEEQRCAAAGRATDNLSRWYQATYGAVGAGIANSLSSMNEFLANLNDLLAGIAFGSYYEIAKAAGFIELYEATQYAAPELDQAAREALVCLLYDNATVGAYQVVSFNFGAVRDNVIDALGINPGTATWTHLNYLGEEGLNRLGEAGTFGEGYDCGGLCDDIPCTPVTGYTAQVDGGGCVLNNIYRNSVMANPIADMNNPPSGCEFRLWSAGDKMRVNYRDVSPGSNIKYVAVPIAGSGGGGYLHIDAGNQTWQSWYYGGGGGVFSYTFPVAVDAPYFEVRLSGGLALNVGSVTFSTECPP